MSKKEYLFDLGKVLELFVSDLRAGIFFRDVIVKLREDIPNDNEKLKKCIGLAYNIIKNDIVGFIHKKNDKKDIF